MSLIQHYEIVEKCFGNPGYASKMRRIIQDSYNAHLYQEPESDSKEENNREKPATDQNH